MSARPTPGSAIRNWSGSSTPHAATAGAKAQPNPAHYALADLETRIGDRFFLCTQNVDDLHERAGSVRLLHMHGELNKAHCERDCGAASRRRPRHLRQSLRSRPLLMRRPSPPAHRLLRRNSAAKWTASADEIDKATLMLVIGTSGSVYPAAGFVHWAHQEGSPHHLHRPRAPAQRPRLHPGSRRQSRRSPPLAFEVE